MPGTSRLLSALDQVRADLVSADREVVEPLLNALEDSLSAIGPQGTTRVLALWLESGLREAATTITRPQSAAHAEQVAETVATLAQILTDSGLDGLDATLRLALLAAAKGDSKVELNHVLERFKQGLTSNAFVSLNPHNKRFPVEIVSTGASEGLLIRGSVRAVDL